MLPCVNLCMNFKKIEWNGNESKPKEDRQRIL
jgi:hypothetical protein